MENWKTIPTFEDYIVSDLGRIWSIKNQKFRSLFQDKNGYLTVKLSRNKIKVGFYVHRLVLLAFVGKSDLQVNHINGIKNDNRLENLEYVTQFENMKHAFQNGLNHPPHLKGENHGSAKLTQNQINQIRELYNTGNYTQQYLANKFSVHQAHISRIILNKLWA